MQIDLSEEIIHVERVTNFEDDDYLLFTTKLNLVKLTKISDFYALRYNRPLRAIGLNRDDTVVHVTRTNSLDAEVITLSNYGHALRYTLEEIPVTSTAAKGVKAMSLGTKYTLAASVVLKDYHDLVLLTSRGTLKRVNILDIPLKKRTQKGVAIINQPKSNPYYLVDGGLINSTHYKNRALIHVVTNKAHVAVSAFELKLNASETGKKFVKSSLGKPRHMIIEPIELDESLQHLSEYKRKKIEEEVQPSLFDDIEE